MLDSPACEVGVRRWSVVWCLGHHHNKSLSIHSCCVCYSLHFKPVSVSLHFIYTILISSIKWQNSHSLLFNRVLTYQTFHHTTTDRVFRVFIRVRFRIFLTGQSYPKYLSQKLSIQRSYCTRLSRFCLPGILVKNYIVLVWTCESILTNEIWAQSHKALTSLSTQNLKAMDLWVFILI